MLLSNSVSSSSIILEENATKQIEHYISYELLKSNQAHIPIKHILAVWPLLKKKKKKLAPYF